MWRAGESLLPGLLAVVDGKGRWLVKPTIETIEVGGNLISAGMTVETLAARRRLRRLGVTAVMSTHSPDVTIDARSRSPSTTHESQRGSKGPSALQRVTPWRSDVNPLVGRLATPLRHSGTAAQRPRCFMGHSGDSQRAGRIH